MNFWCVHWTPVRDVLMRFSPNWRLNMVACAKLFLEPINKQKPLWVCVAHTKGEISVCVLTLVLLPLAPISFHFSLIFIITMTFWANWACVISTKTLNMCVGFYSRSRLPAKVKIVRRWLSFIIDAIFKTSIRDFCPIRHSLGVGLSWFNLRTFLNCVCYDLHASVASRR